MSESRKFLLSGSPENPCHCNIRHNHYLADHDKSIIANYLVQNAGNVGVPGNKCSCSIYGVHDIEKHDDILGKNWRNIGLEPIPATAELLCTRNTRIVALEAATSFYADRVSVLDNVIDAANTFLEWLERDST